METSIMVYGWGIILSAIFVQATLLSIFSLRVGKMATIADQFAGWISQLPSEYENEKKDFLVHLESIIDKLPGYARDIIYTVILLIVTIICKFADIDIVWVPFWLGITFSVMSIHHIFKLGEWASWAENRLTLINQKVLIDQITKDSTVDFSKKSEVDTSLISDDNHSIEG